MHESIAWEHHFARFFLLHDGVVGCYFLYTLSAEVDVEHAHLSQKRLYVSHHHAEFSASERESHVRSYDVCSHIVCVVFRHHARRNVDADHFCLRRIDVFHHRCESSSERFVEPGAEESIDYERIFSESRRLKFLRYLGEPFEIAHLFQSFAVLFTVRRQPSGSVEEIHIDRVMLRSEHPCHRKGIATIVSRSRKHYDRSACLPRVNDGIGKHSRSPLHQVDG